MNIKNRSLFILTLSLFTIPLFSASLFQVRSNIGVSKQRLVFDIDGSINYKVSKDKRSVIIEINNCSLPSKVNRQKIEGRFVNNFKLRKEGNSKVVATFNLADDYKFNVFRMNNVVVDKKRNIKGDKIVLDVSTKRGSSKRKTVKAKETKKVVPKSKKTIKSTKKKKIKPVATLASVINSYQNKKYTETINQATAVLKAKPRLLLAKYYLALSRKALALSNKNSKKRLKSLKTAAALLENVLADSTNFSEARTVIVEIYRLLKDDDKALEHNMIFMSNLNSKQAVSDLDTTQLIKSQDSKYSGIVDSSKLKLQQNGTDSSGNSSYFKIIISIVAVIVLLLIFLLIFLKRRINKQLLEEIEDEEIEESSPESQTAEKSEVEVEKIKEEEEIEQPLAVPGEELITTKTQEELDSYIEDKLETSLGESSISISLGLDQNIRDRVCELFDDGFTNREIAEALEISKDEVDFIVRSIDEEDNENKKNKEEYLNEELTGVSEAENVGDIAEEVVRLKEEGLSALEIAEKLEKNIGEVDFILSIDEKKKADRVKAEIKSEGQAETAAVPDIEEKENSVTDIISLAEQGLSKKEISEKLMIGLDEVEFAASLYDIPLGKKNKEVGNSDQKEDTAEAQQMESVPVNEPKIEEVETTLEEIVSENKPEIQDEKELIDQIISLAKQGYSKQKIAKELSVSIDEVEFAAALHYDVDFIDEPLTSESEEDSAPVKSTEEVLIPAEEKVTEPEPVLQEQAIAEEETVVDGIQILEEEPAPVKSTEEVLIPAEETVTETEPVLQEQAIAEEETVVDEIQTLEEEPALVKSTEEVLIPAEETVIETEPVLQDQAIAEEETVVDEIQTLEEEPAPVKSTEEVLIPAEETVIEAEPVLQDQEDYLTIDSPSAEEERVLPSEKIEIIAQNRHEVETDAGEEKEDNLLKTEESIDAASEIIKEENPDQELDDIISRMETAFDDINSAEALERENITKRVQEKEKNNQNMKTSHDLDLESLLSGNSVEFAESRIYSYDEEIFDDAFKNSLDASTDIIGDIIEEDSETPSTILAGKQLQKESLNSQLTEDEVSNDSIDIAKQEDIVDTVEDDDMKIMRRIYNLLDQGKGVEEISQLTGLSENEIILYQKIKEGSD